MTLLYLLFYPLMRLMNQANPLSEIGRAVINAIEHGYKKQIIESKDFKILVNSTFGSIRRQLGQQRQLRLAHGKKVGFQPSFSCHAKADASIALVIWLNEKVVIVVRK